MPQEQVEVYPADKRWRHRRRSDEGRASKPSKPFTTRAEALAAARESVGGGLVELVRDGKTIGTQQLPTEVRVVLLRADGSEVGELNPPPPGSDSPQRVDLTPAGTEESAG